MSIMNLPQDPFFGPGGRRAIRAETARRFEAVAEATPIIGFARMIDAGDAACGSDRIAGFTAQYDRREWLFRQDAVRDMVWETAPVPAERLDRVAFLLNLGFGNGSPLPQPTGHWEIYVNNRLAVSVRVVNHAQAWSGGACTLAFAANRIETAEPFGSLCLGSLMPHVGQAAFGPGVLVVPSSWLGTGAPATLRVHARADSPSALWFNLAPHTEILEWGNVWAAVRLLAEPHPRLGDFQVFFGDIHTHSGQVRDACRNEGCGWGTREENYAYARGPGGLDFYALTDHEWQIDPADTRGYLDLADRFNEEGRFVCLPGYEYTNQLYGHRNVYFRSSGGDVFSTHSAWDRPSMDPRTCTTPRELWRAMEQTGVPFITVPHHPSALPHPLSFEGSDPRYDRLFEIYSTWGSSEYDGDFPRGVSDRWPGLNYRNALARGLRCGVVAASDGHDGHPGHAQGMLAKHHHVFHFCGSGRTAVLAPELTRAAVFDALHARRCYATTGTPMLLDVRAGGAVMGSERPAVPPDSHPVLAIACTGTNGLDHLRIMRNARVAATIPCHGERGIDLEWEDPAAAGTAPLAYYVRVVQKDRESAWSSPIWFG